MGVHSPGDSERRAMARGCAEARRSTYPRGNACDAAIRRLVVVCSAVSEQEDPSLFVGTQAIAVKRLELFTTVFVTGSVVMTVEIVGARVIGPVFGVGLFVWSALLTVTMGALALGYYAGGVLSERVVTSRLLGSVVSAAGVTLALVRILRHLVLETTLALGPRWGSLVSATLLFAPCIVALGMVGPIAVRMATREIHGSGRSVGSIYAVSTAGSLVGALLVGFVIVPLFDTDAIFAWAALLLLAVGAGSLFLRNRRGAVGLLALPLLCNAMPPRALPAGIERIEQSHSLYGLVEVITDQNRGVRFLRADHSIIGAQFIADGSPGFDFVYLLEAVRFCRPRAKNVLNIGLGIGSVPARLGKLGLKVDVVELDPAVVRFAQQYFGYSPNGAVHVEDARTFINRDQQRYDIIIHDTFTGGGAPEHLLSLEVMQRLHGLLRPGGALALNFPGYVVGSNAEASFAVARTLRAVFPTVRIFSNDLTGGTADAGNLIFFASDRAIEFVVPKDAQFENSNEERASRSLEAQEVLKHVPDGALITDGHNPLARLQIPVAEKHFKAMNELLPSEVWLD
jgi:SAM-dependent methyltransferase